MDALLVGQVHDFFSSQKLAASSESGTFRERLHFAPQHQQQRQL